MAAISNLLYRKKQDVDMTQGSIARHIITFALPLLVGNIFQQLYNTVDTWVVGNFVSNEAYAAVGTVGPIVNMLIGFFVGLSSGAGVVISQYYGAHRDEDVQKSVHTAIVMTLCMAVAFTILGIVLTPFMLQLMKMPANVIPEATTYLQIYFGGIIGLMLYNIGSGILRAVGDSQRPFYFLVVCAILNTVLDLVFVLKFHMGVAGVALATILSQAVSAVLVMITLLRTSSCVRLRPSKLKIHWPVLKKIFTVGVPAAIQMCITAFSNIFVQSYINFFGDNCMSGWTTYAKVDQLLFLPMQSISLASTTFVGQNLGSNQPERARRGVKIALILAMTSTAVLCVPVVAFAPSIVSFFNSKAEVVEYGAMLLRWLSPFYLLCCFNQIYSGALRGAGNSKAPMVIMLTSFVAFRQVYLFVMSGICNEILPIAMSYPAGWLLCSVLTAVYYHKTKLTKTRLVDDKVRRGATMKRFSILSALRFIVVTIWRLALLIAAVVALAFAGLYLTLQTVFCGPSKTARDQLVLTLSESPLTSAIAPYFLDSETLAAIGSVENTFDTNVSDPSMITLTSEDTPPAVYTLDFSTYTAEITLFYGADQLDIDLAGQQNYAGFTADGILILTDSMEKAQELGLSGTCDHLLILNGQANEALFAATSSYAPRTAIGQLADGQLVLVTTDGWNQEHIGATYRDLINIMTHYGAVNACVIDSEDVLWKIN